MYPYFRGNPERKNVVDEFTERKNDKLAEIRLIEEYYKMPRPADNDIYDDIDILIEMKTDGWDVKKLPQYEPIRLLAAKRGIVERQLRDDH